MHISHQSIVHILPFVYTHMLCAHCTLQHTIKCVIVCDDTLRYYILHWKRKNEKKKNGQMKIVLLDFESFHFWEMYCALFDIEHQRRLFFFAADVIRFYILSLSIVYCRSGQWVKLKQINDRIFFFFLFWKTKIFTCTFVEFEFW